MTSPDWTDDETDTILGIFDTRTLTRAREYAANGMILDIEWADGMLTGISRGSGSQRYQCRVRVSGSGSTIKAAASCTCPVAIRCKHAAALVMAATIDGTTLDRRTPAPTGAMPLSRWRTLIDEVEKSAKAVATIPDGPELSLGLMFSVHRSYRDADTVNVRPLVLNEQGRWVKSRLTWKMLVSGKITDRYSADALDILTRLASVLAINRQGGAIPDEMSLMQAPVSLWKMLDEARDAGIEFQNGKTSRTTVVSYGDRLSTQLHVMPQHAGVFVALEVLVDGEVAPHSPDKFRFAIGRPRAHGLAQEFDDVLYLGPIPHLTSTESMLLVSGVPLEVADDDLGAFQKALPKLQADRPVVVDQDAFPASTLTGPFPVLRIRTDDPATAQWSAGYEADGQVQEFPAQGPTSGRFRSAAAERAMWGSIRQELEMVAKSNPRWVVLAADKLQKDLASFRSDYRRFNRMYAVLRQLQGGASVAAAFDSVPDYQSMTVPLSPLQAAIMVSEVVPDITELGRVRVIVEGTPLDYRPAESPPVLSFSGDASRDWFDLEVSLDVDDHKIPITTIIAALASGETHMLLDDGTYFSLDIPSLQTLRDRLAEARELGEIDGDRVSTHTLNASLWDELLELGVVDEQLAVWRQRIAHLAAAKPPHAVVPPAGLDADLRPYQQEGLEWLTFLWENRLGGILADDMGLGKTVQTLALMQQIVDEQPDARFLVVAPTSVIANWAAECLRFVPGLNAVTSTATEKRIGVPLAERAADAQIVITSYALLRIDYDAFATVDWTGVFFDEAQFLKNHQAKTYQAARRLEATFKIAVTGTPLENRVMELWSLVSVVAPGLYNSPRLFKEHFAEPIESGQAPERLEILRRRLRPIMLRRTKDQVLTDLPEKQEQLLPIELEPKHRKIYDTYLARDRQQLLGLLDDFSGNRIQVLRALTRLRQLSLHPTLVDDEHAAVKSAKIEYLSEQLPSLIDEGHSALIFSSFTGFLKLVAAELDSKQIAYSYLDGSTPITARGKQIEQFTDGTNKVFLISLKAGGFGLNLTAADYIFMTDPWWNPAAENQAVDRAHRIGQHRAVTVYRMVATGTIEEKVIDLQTRKRELFNALIDDGAAFSGAITADDVRGLLGE